jgi:hypothetical protein
MGSSAKLLVRQVIRLPSSSLTTIPTQSVGIVFAGVVNGQDAPLCHNCAESSAGSATSGFQLCGSNSSMRLQPRENVFQVRIRIMAIELGRLDQRRAPACAPPHAGARQTAMPFDPEPPGDYRAMHLAYVMAWLTL